MGILAHSRLRRGDADGFEQIKRPAPRAAAGRMLVDADRLRHLIPDREERVQRRHRVLEDHRDPLAADPPHLAVGLLEQVFALEEDLARDEPGRRREQPQQRERQGGLAGARLAHDPERPALVEDQRDVVHRTRDARAARAHVVGGEMPKLEERAGHN